MGFENMMDETMNVMTDCCRSDGKSDIKTMAKSPQKCGETKSDEEETVRHSNERLPNAKRGEGQTENCCFPTTLGK